MTIPASYFQQGQYIRHLFAQLPMLRLDTLPEDTQKELHATYINGIEPLMDAIHGVSCALWWANVDENFNHGQVQDCAMAIQILNEVLDFCLHVSDGTSEATRKAWPRAREKAKS